MTFFIFLLLHGDGIIISSFTITVVQVTSIILNKCKTISLSCRLVGWFYVIPTVVRLFYTTTVFFTYTSGFYSFLCNSKSPDQVLYNFDKKKNVSLKINKNPRVVTTYPQVLLLTVKPINKEFINVIQWYSQSIKAEILAITIY